MRRAKAQIDPRTPLAIPVAHTQQACHYAPARRRRNNLCGYGSGSAGDTGDTKINSACVGHRVTQTSEIKEEYCRDTGDTAFSSRAIYVRARMHPHDREGYFICVTGVTRDYLNEIIKIRDTLPDTPDFFARVGCLKCLKSQRLIRHTCKKGGF